MLDYLEPKIMSCAVCGTEFDAATRMERLPMGTADVETLKQQIESLQQKVADLAQALADDPPARAKK